MKYEHECCRCGFCCLSETCPAGAGIYGISKSTMCPALTFKDDIATCKLITLTPPMNLEDMKRDMGVGTGCCIKARAFKDGVGYDFAALPKKMKVWCARKERGLIA